MQICNSLIVLIQMVALIDAVHSSFIPEAHPNEKNLEEYLSDSVKRLESKTLEEKSLKEVKPGIEKTGDKKYVITPIPKKKKTMSEDDDLSDPYLVKCLKQESPIEEIEKDMGNPETVRAFLTCEDAKANKTKNMSSENIEEEKARLGVMPPEEIAPSESDMTVTEDGTSKVLIVRIEPEKKKTVDISDISVKTIEEKQTLRERGGLDNSDDTIKRLEQGVKSPDTDKVNVESIKNKNVFGDISLVEPEKKRPLKGPKEEKMMSEDYDSSDPYLVKCLKQESPIVGTENGMGNPSTCEEVKANKTDNMSLEYTEMKKARDGVIPPEEIALSNSGMPVTENGTSKVLITRIEPDNKKTVEISDISLKPLEEKKTLRKRDAVDDSRGNMPLKYTEEKKARDSVIPSEEIAPSNSDMTVTENGTSKVLITRIEPDNKKTVEISDISLKPLEEKKTLRKRDAVDDSRGNMPLKYTEEKKARDSVIPSEEIAPSNSDMTVTENGTSKVLITRIEPDNKKTVEISDISLKPLEEKKTSRKRDAVDDSRGNMPFKYTEEKKARNGVMPPEDIAPSNSDMTVTENGTSKVLITRIEPDNKKTVEISDISLKPLEEKKTLRKRDAVDNSDDTVKRLEQGEPNNLLAKVLGIPISSTTETAVVEIANNTEMKPGLESERTVTNQQLLSNTTSSTLDKPTIEVFRMESTTINSKSGNNSDADSRVKIQGTNQLPTDSPKFQIQVDTTISTKEPGTFEERTQMEVTQTEKPTLFGRMKHNRHRKLHSEENEEDKPVGSVPCTCGVFLSGQFKKGSKQQPKGLPVLTQEMDNPFMNNAMGSRQCTNKCLELIIKHLPKSSEIICATVDRENVFKERAYLFIKNHSDKWHGTNLSAGREFCCRDNTPYKCPAS
ncbi:follicle cell protein 3C isoform X2 [Leptinotarsa decemlineata]|uniref:follicle cell protein 3C isoform X2 n=1 Tax=Leptinotarsa decemlineata TaxID=7539 RepID=UPI003D308397